MITGERAIVLLLRLLMIVSATAFGLGTSGGRMGFGSYGGERG